MEPTKNNTTRDGMRRDGYELPQAMGYRHSRGRISLHPDVNGNAAEHLLQIPAGNLPGRRGGRGRGARHAEGADKESFSQ